MDEFEKALDDYVAAIRQILKSFTFDGSELRQAEATLQRHQTALNDHCNDHGCDPGFASGQMATVLNPSEG